MNQKRRSGRNCGRAVLALGFMAWSACSGEPPTTASPPGDVDQVSSPIINGDVAPRAEEPRAVKLTIKTPFNPPVTCGGHLISSHWVLTARHCTGNIGTLVWPTREPQPAEVTVEQFDGSKSTATHLFRHPSLDVALVRIGTAAPSNPPAWGDDQGLFSGSTASLVGKNVTCYGYGATNRNGTQGVGTFRKEVVRVTSGNPTEFVVTTNTRGQISAPFDSGTPCYLDHDAIGTLSHGNFTTDTYISIEGLRPWIFSTMTSAAAPTSLGTDSRPAAVTWEEGRQTVLLQDASLNRITVWTRNADRGDDVSSIDGPPVGMAGDLTGTTRLAGRFDVFVRGGDAAIWTRHFDGTNWLDWFTLGGVCMAGVGATPVLGDANGALMITCTGTDGTLYANSWTSSTGWSGWNVNLGAPPVGITASATPAMAPSLWPIVYARGEDGAIWARWATDFGVWVSLGGFTDGSPTVVLSRNRHLVFTRGGDGQVWMFQGNTPGAWQQLADPIGSSLSPTACSRWGGSQVDLYVVGSSSDLFTRTFAW